MSTLAILPHAPSASKTLHTKASLFRSLQHATKACRGTQDGFGIRLTLSCDGHLKLLLARGYTDLTEHINVRSGHLVVAQQDANINTGHDKKRREPFLNFAISSPAQLLGRLAKLQLRVALWSPAPPQAPCAAQPLSFRKISRAFATLRLAG